MASRYDSPNNASTSFVPTVTDTRTSGGSSTSGSSNSNSRTTELSDLIKQINSQTQGTSVTESDTLIREFEKQLLNIDTMSDAGREGMNQTLAQLLAGGTDEQRRIQEEQLKSIQNLREQQQSYTRDTALADAEGLMQKLLRQGLEGGMPQIQLAQSGAGTSGNALSALLTQDLATRSAESAASAGVNAVGSYGSILAQLTGQEASATGGLEDIVTKALLNALQIDKGSMQRGEVITEKERREKGTSTTKSNSSTTGRETTSGSNVTNQSGSSSQRASGSQWGNSVSTVNRLPTGSITNMNR
jgi:hypothetical protein